ncbi:glycogen debranching protein [Roseiconus nitratireducens]|uniref:Glycogen debranching protein n=1 Tax=Roseiconus nitratireducens TaxID=2605748 RepID=A0A5M6D512_9BACT|nr:amylo-alpha-1,6-glucosidase [Roseiconus nitratireducens]KAA5542608.1 glycogen debranching protein [Roseiconus nitratireducens]
MPTFVREPTWSGSTPEQLRQLYQREWLVTAGNGGYASGTLGFVPTRRHHGLLISNHPEGRVLSLSQLREDVLDSKGDTVGSFWGVQHAGSLPEIHCQPAFKRFQLRDGLPSWTFRVGQGQIVKSMIMPHRRNAVCVRYLPSGVDEDLRFRVRPMIQFRGHNDSVDSRSFSQCTQRAADRFEFSDGSSGRKLQLQMAGGQVTWSDAPLVDSNCLYAIEEARGYDHVGALASPGFFEWVIKPDQPFTVIAFTDDEFASEPWDPAAAFEAENRRREELLARLSVQSADVGFKELVFAADQFIIEPPRRLADLPDQASDVVTESRRSVIAGYPWFTDWGRDTMISLPGLTLACGRYDDARAILITFANYVRDGLIPNLFPEGGQEGMYHTADATLWFFQAIHEYEAATGDLDLVRQLMPKLQSIIRCHLSGTRFGIGVDPQDGLLIQGQPDVQLTWMDAKAGDWVVTPRSGKAVEINALWYNALELFRGWDRRCGDSNDSPPVDDWIEMARVSFNRRFWSDHLGYLLDVVDGDDGDDAALRPNQLFAVSLEHPVLDREHWADMVQTVARDLVTPVGLRSLSPNDPEYHGVYRGDVWQRDGAYHQGTVWSWLIGPFVRAWCRAFPDRADQAETFLNGLERHLDDACIGQVSEIFDGDPPHHPKGCFAQAWGVAELLQAKRVIREWKGPRSDS